MRWTNSDDLDVLLCVSYYLWTSLIHRWSCIECGFCSVPDFVSMRRCVPNWSLLPSCQKRVISVNTDVSFPRLVLTPSPAPSVSRSQPLIVHDCRLFRYYFEFHTIFQGNMIDCVADPPLGTAWTIGEALAWALPCPPPRPHHHQDTSIQTIGRSAAQPPARTTCPSSTWRTSGSVSPSTQSRTVRCLTRTVNVVHIYLFITELRELTPPMQSNFEIRFERGLTTLQ